MKRPAASLTHAFASTSVSLVLLAGFLLAVTQADAGPRELGDAELRRRGDLGQQATADDFVPLRGTGPLPSGSNDLRRNLQPAVAWTPGGPDAGGGSGDPWEPASEGTRFDLEILPEVGGTSCGTIPFCVAANGAWVGGQSGVLDNTCNSCSAAVLWHYDAANGWTIHVLPGPTSTNAENGNVHAVLDDGTGVGTSRRFEAGCVEIRAVPVLWEPIGIDVWRATELPTPLSNGFARALADSRTLGRLIVGEVHDTGALWRWSAGGWAYRSFGNVGGDVRVSGVNDAGTVVGWAQNDVAGDYLPFVLVPIDSDGDGMADTWHQDADGDGANDLMVTLAEPAGSGPAAAVNDRGVVVGSAGVEAMQWQRNTDGAWQETALPRGRFSERATAMDLNLFGQVVGTGYLSGPSGSTEARGLLWESVDAGWRLLELGDVTEMSRFDAIKEAEAIGTCGDVVTRGSTKDDNNVALFLRARSTPCE